MRAALVLFLSLSMSGCSDAIEASPGEASQSHDASTSSDAHADGSRASACAERGALAILPDGALCSGALAQATFGHAVCTCAPHTGSDSFQTNTFDSRVGPYTAGPTTTAPVHVPGRCACGANDRVLPGRVLEDFALSAGENLAAGFDQSLLFDYGGDTTIDLPCGRLYAAGASGAGKLTLRVAGPTALVIEGDLVLDSDFTVQVVGDGELDLFVSGDLVLGGRITLGDARTPSRVRLYVGGSRTIALDSGGAFAGNIHAPNATVVVGAKTELYGSIFAGAIAGSDALTVHADEAMRSAGAACSAP